MRAEIILTLSFITGVISFFAIKFFGCKTKKIFNQNQIVSPIHQTSENSIDTKLTSHEDITLEEVVATVRQKSKSDKSDFLILKDGRSRIRIFPGRQGQLHFVARRQHYLGKDEGNVVMCTKRLVPGTENLSHEESQWQGKCPICDRVKHLWATASIAGKDRFLNLEIKFKSKARKVKARERFYYQVELISHQAIDSKSPPAPNSEPRVMIWSCGRFVHDEIQKYVLKSGDSNQDFVDLNNTESPRDLFVYKNQRPNSYPSYQIWFSKNSVFKTLATESEFFDLEAVTKHWERPIPEMINVMKNADIEIRPMTEVIC